MTVPIAIVGIGGLYPSPGAPADPAQLWQQARDGIDCSRDVPPHRWFLDPNHCLDATGPRKDHVYSRRACFLDTFSCDTTALSVPSELLQALDPLVRLTVRIGVEAWRSAQTAQLDRSRVGIILGNIALPTESVSQLAREILGNTILEKIPGGRPIPFATDPRNIHVTGLGAGILARALGLGGTCYTLDAACASSLYSLALGCVELQAGRADAMLVGGTSRPDSLYTQMGFAQLRALSTRGRCYPFDTRACGLIVGEGGGVFVLKRLVDALNHGDTIHALIAGHGLSNDVGGGLLAPSTAGQIRALQLAYRRAGWSPADVDLIECHATGTPVGDQIEYNSLRQLWGESGWRPRQCVLSSVKSTVGHLLTAAGAAGLTKTLFALKHHQFPPTANFDSPPEGIDLIDGPFRVLTQVEPWPSRQPRIPRRAAISGFGFGGINAHVLLEEWIGQENGSVQPVGTPGHQTTVAVGTIPSVTQETASNPARIAIVGRSARLGSLTTIPQLRHQLLGEANRSGLKPPVHWWGVDAAQWFSRRGLPGSEPAGYYLDHLDISLEQFRIPPRELEEMLPQQLLMLLTADDLLRDRSLQPEIRERTGVYIGLALDLNTTNFTLRWSLEPLARQWAQQQGFDPFDPRITAWVESLRTAVAPDLTANRTVGALGSIVASRIAREYNLGGPSYAISSEETSGFSALEAAMRALQSGDIDLAVVGAVDLPGDVRAVLSSTDRTQPPADGAIAFLLRREADAIADGDPISCLLQGIAMADSEAMAQSRAWQQAGLSPNPETFLETVFSTADRVGHTGAASGLVSLLRVCLALEENVLPDPTRFWLRNQGRRQALVTGGGSAGTVASVVVQEFPGSLGNTGSLGPLQETLLLVTGLDPQEVQERALQLIQRAREESSLSSLGRLWPASPEAPFCLAVVARSTEELIVLLAQGRRHIQEPDVPLPPGIRDRIFWSGLPLGQVGRLAFVYPGSGNDFPGMGRELAITWPEVLREQHLHNHQLRGQFLPHCYWDRSLTEPTPPERLCAQVAVGTLITDILLQFGIQPEAAIGYSLGESTALFALHAWTDRDDMFRRLKESTLFQSDLNGSYAAARRFWNLEDSELVNWITGVVPCPAEAVRHVIAGESRVYLLIVNTPGECILGGQRDAVERVVRRLGVEFLPLPGMSSFHCPVVSWVATSYRDLHLLPTAPPGAVVFYSGALGHGYEVNRENAADAILAQALDTLDFPQLIRNAYEDGIRLFVEVGPGGSCSRMIGSILGDLPHRARSACVAGSDGVGPLLRVLAMLAAERFPLDLTALYKTDSADLRSTPERTLRVSIGGPPFEVPSPPSISPLILQSPPPEPVQVPKLAIDLADCWSRDQAAALQAVLQQVVSLESEQALAHAAYLRLSTTYQDSMASTLAFQTALLERFASEGSVLYGGSVLSEDLSRPDRVKPSPDSLPPQQPPRSLDRAACMEYAIGSIGRVLGPDYAVIDGFPTRVRLPDEPLMLVDRILAIEGEPLVLDSGRVITEHDIHPGAWYLDHNKIPTCIAVEAGQADLFLSGYLGIDLQTRGLAVYRLLDAVVTFHRGLPGPGEVIHYDIRIDRFLRQGETILFRFQFVGTVNGEPLLTMRDGCAGFFTERELAAGKGVVQTALDLRPGQGVATDDSADLPPCGVERYDARQVDALRQGDLVSAFGPCFGSLPLHEPLRLPSGRMNLVHRVPLLDPQGGRFGIGFIRGEADIHPEDWFLTCHFVDDQVMPGTLMYECCLHTLRILLMRRGWVGEQSEVAFEPVPGVGSQLKCRGQVTARTRLVTYEVTIKERGYRPEPYVIGDALMIADGKPVVEIRNLSLQLTGLSRERIQQIWARAGQQTGIQRFDGSNPVSGQTARANRRVLYGPEQILAFSNGKPSEAFGEPYRVFDGERTIARLPGPPYQFLDRIVAVGGEPWKMVAGAWAEAEYDIPPDAWYFAADGQELMPFAVLLEVALQPCGWLAAYVGSALTSSTDLSFRNLGGTAEYLQPVTPLTGTLVTRVKLTRVASSGGMIIQNYDFEVSASDRVVYRGDTVFGFFSRAALAQQVGIREAKPPIPTPEDRAQGISFNYPGRPGFPDSRWRMIDSIELLSRSGGPNGLGLVRGIKQVRRDDWFFAAHFFQDPVIPGSLGLESLLQLLKVLACERWGDLSSDSIPRFVPMTGNRHSWQYRGQVIPTNHEVLVQAVITACDDQKQELKADGYLWADGKVIYQMTDFTLEMTKNHP